MILASCCKIIQHIINPDNFRVMLWRILIHNRSMCTFFNCLRGEMITVEILTFQGKEQASGNIFRESVEMILFFRNNIV